MGPDDARVAQLRNWSHSLASLRWEAIVDFTGDLLKLEPLLRQTWDKRKFLGGTAPTAGSGPGHRRWKADAAGEHGVTVDSIHAAITSPAFWTGVALVHDLSYEAEFIGRWCEGCGCCPMPGRQLRLQDAKPLPRQRQQRLSCPYKGCRAAELASGEWVGHLQDVMISSKTNVAHCLVMSRDTERAQYFSDWSQARAKLWAGIHIKLAYWKQLPWRL